MEQIIEQAAIAFANKCRTLNIKGRPGCPYDELDMRNAFKEGAKWQSKRMAWTSVSDKMPEDGIEVNEKTICAHTKDVIVLYRNGYVGKGKRIYVDINKGRWEWSCLNGEDITHWMHFPINI